MFTYEKIDSETVSNFLMTLPVSGSKNWNLGLPDSKAYVCVLNQHTLL